MEQKVTKCMEWNIAIATAKYLEIDYTIEKINYEGYCSNECKVVSEKKIYKLINIDEALATSNRQRYLKYIKNYLCLSCNLFEVTIFI